jgi:hypothetical protein
MQGILSMSPGQITPLMGIIVIFIVIIIISLLLMYSINHVSFYCGTRIVLPINILWDYAVVYNYVIFIS